VTRIEKSIEIRAPTEKVWEMLAFERFPEWLDECKNSEYTSKVRTPEDKYRVGASAHITEKHVEYDLEVTESLENEKIAFRSKGMRRGRVKGPTMTLTHTLKPVEEGTKLTYAMDYEMPGGILGKGLDKLFGEKHAEKGIEKSLSSLKSILEK